jgi:hypothetical protein
MEISSNSKSNSPASKIANALRPSSAATTLCPARSSSHRRQSGLLPRLTTSAHGLREIGCETVDPTSQVFVRQAAPDVVERKNA